MAMYLELRPTERPGSVMVMWVFSLVFLAATFGLGAAFLQDAQAGGRVLIVAGLLLFGFVALAATAATLEQTWQVIKFGRVHLYLEGSPRIGDPLNATLLMPARFGPVGHVQGKLLCRGLEWRAGNDGFAIESVVWLDVQTVATRLDRRRWRAEFCIAVPPDAPASDTPADLRRLQARGLRGQTKSIRHGVRYHEWELQVTAQMPGLDLRRTYPVEVRPSREQRLRDTAGRREFEPRST